MGMEKLEFTELTRDDVDEHIDCCVSDCIEIPVSAIKKHMCIRFIKTFGENDAGN